MSNQMPIKLAEIIMYLFDESGVTPDEALSILSALSLQIIVNTKQCSTEEAYSFLISNLIKGKKKPHIENLN